MRRVRIGRRDGGGPRRRRLAVAVVALAAAAFAALLASDLRSWRSAVRAGDARYAVAPESARWQAQTILPDDPALGILGLPGQLSFRRTARSFGPVAALGNGVDNGYTESRERAGMETVLAKLAQGPDPARDSEAENMLGILAFNDSQQHGPNVPAPVQRAVSAFQAAVRLDPSNAAAKFNLEWLQRKLLAKGSRPGSGSSNAGPAKGHKGAGGGIPGRGY